MATDNARLATWISAAVDERLRLTALLRRQRLSQLITDLLDQTLPCADELAARLQPGPARMCRRCGRPIAQSRPSGLWWAIDDIPVGEAPDCVHEPSRSAGGAHHDH